MSSHDHFFYIFENMKKSNFENMVLKLAIENVFKKVSVRLGNDHVRTLSVFFSHTKDKACRR